MSRERAATGGGWLRGFISKLRKPSTPRQRSGQHTRRSFPSSGLTATRADGTRLTRPSMGARRSLRRRHNAIAKASRKVNRGA